MATNINKIIFTKTAPKKKLEIINSLSQGELLAITYSTILRIIKEAGRGDSNKKRSKFKTLFLEDAGNKWNSKVTNIYNWKKDEVHLSVYIQGDDTDTFVFPRLKDFLDNRYEEQCMGKLHESFRNGYEHDVPANYNRTDRARVVKSILTAYVKNKYADKLQEGKMEKTSRATVSHFGPSVFEVAKYIHHETIRHCDFCGKPMNRSDVNDYGTLCESCYMKEYYG